MAPPPAVTRTERTYYLIVALWSFPGWFMHPVYPMFLLSRGLDLFQINVILAIFLISTFAFEVPTGAVADVYGRKISFLLSCAIRPVAFVLYYFAHGFWGCAVAEIIDAIGLTLATGALEAWAIDGARAEGDLRPADRMFARAAMVTRTTMIAGGLLCGALADRYGLGVPWLVAAAVFVVALFVGAFTMYDDRPLAMPAGSTSTRPSLFAMVGAGLGAVRGHRVMRAICVLTLLGALAMMPVVMMWPPRLEALAGGSYWMLGKIWALLNLTAVVGAALAAYLAPRVRRDWLLAVIALWRGAFLAAAAAASRFTPVVGWLLLYEAGVAASEPIKNAWMNEHVRSDLRATVLSVQGMSFTLGGALGLVTLGLLARSTTIPTAWAVAAAIFIAIAPGFLWLGGVADREDAAALERHDDEHHRVASTLSTR